MCPMSRRVQDSLAAVREEVESKTASLAAAEDQAQATAAEVSELKAQLSGSESR